MRNGGRVGPPSLPERLWAWRWLAAFVLASLLMPLVFSTHVPIDDSVELLDRPEAWTVSRDMAVARIGEGLSFTRTGPGIQTASRSLGIPSEAQFLRLRACATTPFAADSLVLGAASTRHGVLDFNRPYRLRSDDGGEAGTCLDGFLPRRADDAEAVVQVQLRGPDASLRLRVMTLVPVVEEARWRALRISMLLLGIGLLALRFRAYAYSGPRFAGRLGLLVVAGIVFGCCVSTGLKADIYSLLTGGRSLPVPPVREALLLMAFPTGGFSLFTALHAVLFALAAGLLGLARREAWLDLLLLGAVTETLQLFVPGRGPGLSDMLVDWAGVGLGTVLLLAFRRRQGKGLALE